MWCSGAATDVAACCRLSVVGSGRCIAAAAVFASCMRLATAPQRTDNRQRRARSARRRTKIPVSIWFRRCATFEEEALADREYWSQYSADERLAQMDDLRSDWAEFLACLNRSSVRVLVVGTHALAVHAKPRYTKDLDLFVAPSIENARRIVEALADFGLGDAAITEAGINVITSIDGVSFEEAWAGRIEGTFAGEKVFFIGRDELTRNKAASGRPQDLADLDTLRRFRN